MEKEWMDRLEAKVDSLALDVSDVKVEVGTLKYAVNKRNLLLSALTGLAVAIAAALLGSCAATNKHVANYVNEDVKAQYESAAAVSVECVYPPLPVPAPAIDILAAPIVGVRSGGSAFAVGPRYLMTARHVIDCERTLPGGTYQKGEPVEIVVLLQGGEQVEVVVERAGKDGDHDAALLNIIAGRPDLKVWSRLSQKDPAIGEPACLMASLPFKARSCGEITNYRTGDDWMGTGYITYSMQSIPGNSGSAVYNARGEVVAINVAGTLSLGGGYLTSQWRYMVPPVFADLGF